MSYGDHRTFENVSRVNLERASEWHPNGIDDWSPAEWGNAAAGEMGELCNILKKILRVDHVLRQKRAHIDYSAELDVDLREKLVVAAATEIGDTFLYLDLIAQRLELDMWECVRDTFNRVSEREGFGQRLGL